MKITVVLFASATMYFFTACNNGSQTSATSTDTTASTTNVPMEPAATPQDTTMSGNDLMKSMDDGMAKMQSMQMSGDFDIDFANMMIEHHQGALDMSQVELSQGKDEKMKSKAQEIITKQKDEQQKLRDFVNSYKPSGMKHGEGELQKSMSGTSSNMKSIQMSGDVDKDFAMMMIAHHEDGISMAKMELKNGMSTQLKKMAQKIIDDQQNEIKEFHGWLSANK